MSADELRAILLTDLVDSTLLTARLGDDAYAELAKAHDRLARDLLQTWRGREIDKSDGMLSLFGDVADASGYAVAYHRALAALPHHVTARAGIHFGPVILQPNDSADVTNGAKPIEVEGLSKAIAARAMGLALGGQTLLTAEAREALGRTSLRALSHGHWRVKGIAEPFELFEVGDADAPFKPPPDGAKGYRVVRRADLWLPLRDVPHSLPAERDAFVGRQGPLAELAARLLPKEDTAQGGGGKTRLVSVLGIGGGGKTRLATRFAWQWLGDFPGGAWFCDLSAARSVDGITYAVAQGLDLPLGNEDPVAQIGKAIASRSECLVILDNFEQVARHAEATLGRWLDRAAEARFLVTTREVLGLPGEGTYSLAPLSALDAAVLFMLRAEAAGARPVESGEDTAAVPQLVELLDRLPLAIELVAARTRLMSPRTLLTRMDKRFALVATAGGRRDRQATLRTTFDWSWDLLTDAEKAALAQLSVFEGGFTLEATEAVLDLAACSERVWVVDALQSLVDKSFVRAAADGRYALLGTVQEYAAEHLRTPEHFPQSGPDALDAAQTRHGAYFAAPNRARFGPAAEAEVENIVIACRRATARGDADVAVATLEGTWAALELRGPFRAAADLSLQVVGLAGLSALQRARAGLVAASALDASGQVERAQECFEMALDAARAAQDSALEARGLIGLGSLLANEGRPDDALARLQAALQRARELGDRKLECAALNGLGSACVDQGRTEQAYAHYSQALSMARQIGDRRWEGGLLGNLGGLLMDRGDLERATEHMQASLIAARQLGNRMREGNAMCSLGALHLVQGRLEEAREELAAALALAQSIGHARLECIAGCNLGLVHSAAGRWDDARAALDAALALAREQHDSRNEGLFLGYLARVHANQGRLDEARTCLDDGERLLRKAADRYSLGLIACSRAEVEWLAGATDAAAAALETARALQREAKSGPKSELGVAVERIGRTVDAAG